MRDGSGGEGVSWAVEVEDTYRTLCAEFGRQGVWGCSNVADVRLLPEQEGYLRRLLAPLGLPLTAVSLGLLYHEREVQAIPQRWAADASEDETWEEYARAYTTVNSQLNSIAGGLARRFGGIAEPATVSGWTGSVRHVSEYYSRCISHRAFAQAAGLGWRGRHGLIVTPEVGPVRPGLLGASQSADESGLAARALRQNRSDI